MKIVVATEKPFAKEAVEGIKSIVEKANYQFVLLEKYTSKTELIDALQDADAAIVRSDVFDKEVLESAPKLKVVVRAGAGFDNIDLATSTQKNIVVMNTPGQNANAVAELVFGLAVYAVRNHFNGSSGTELLGKKIGIHAFGNVGQNVARIAKGFGMDVHAFDPFLSQEQIEAKGVKYIDSVENLYATSQVISIHIPATPQTRKSINLALLSKLPQGAIVINTARKEVINEEEMVSLLAQRPDVKYITDIKPSNHEELLKLYPKQYFATPKKMGAQTAEANTNAGIAAANQIVDFFLTGNQKFKVN